MRSPRAVDERAAMNHLNRLNHSSHDSTVGSVDHLVEMIVAINAGADREWLAGFDAYDLHRYLQHLEVTQEPREHAKPWIRLGDTPAIVTRDAA
jgi:hypothetical protein